MGSFVLISQMSTSHSHKYSSPEVANKLNEMEIEETSTELSKNERISKQKTKIFIIIAVLVLIIVGIIIGVLSTSNGAKQELIIEGKMTNYIRKAVPGVDDAYSFIPFLKSEGEQSRFEFGGFLNQIKYSNSEDDVANDFIKVLKEGAIFDEYTFETPLSNADHFEFQLKRSKGLGGKSPSKPEICKTEQFTIQDTENENRGSNNKILVFPCPPSASDSSKYSTLASFVRKAPQEEVKQFFKKAFFDLLLARFDDDDIADLVKNWCFSTSNGTTGWVQGTIDSNSNSCYTT